MRRVAADIQIFRGDLAALVALASARGDQEAAMAEGYQALTAKDAAALRLLLGGHDAKSMANQLGLSVHMINERLRDARRKLSVSSSKAAARHPLPGGERRETARSGCDLRREPARVRGFGGH